VLLAVAHTWPLATAPARLSRNDNADALLNEWIVAWVEHQSASDPLHLADGNMFYPERGTLAYSEYLLLPAALAAPVRAAGASPVLVYNLLILAGFAATGWAGYILIARWTGDAWAGLVGGAILAFNAHTLTRLPQVQALHMECLPLALLLFDQLIDAPHQRSRWTVRWPAPALAVVVALQGWTSYYGLILTLVALGTGWLVRFDRRQLASVIQAAIIGAILLLPILDSNARVGHVRPLDEIAAYSASARDYLATPARVHYETWSARFFGGTTALFPGAVALCLAAVAIASGAALRDRRARMALAFGIAGIALSFGPALPGYALLYRVLIPLRGIRNAARFGYLATVAAAILAGFGAAWLRQHSTNRRRAQVLMVVLLAAVSVDAFSGPIEYIDAEAVSPLHAQLSGTDAIVAEIPVYPVDRVFRNAPYLLHATAHWRPMINGYSGFTPDSYVEHARELARFPDARALATLKSIGVTHVFVHDRALRDWTDNETADAVPHAEGLELLGRDGELALYRLRR
jgi:hypothetical protein